MALKSALSFRRRNTAGWRLVWLAAFATGVLAADVQGWADNPQQAIESAVDGDQIQRNAPLPERARKSIGEIEKLPDIQHNPPAPQPDEKPLRFWTMNLSWLPYAILAVIVGGLLFLLLQYLRNRTGAGAKASAKAAEIVTTHMVATPPAPDAPERDRTFDEIDALAESGAFTEAVHRLLLLVQERLRGRIEHGIQVSLTSREILRRAKLQGEAATAFATLVAAVEVSLFGLRSANAATYALCREHSRRVLAAATGMTP